MLTLMPLHSKNNTFLGLVIGGTIIITFSSHLFPSKESCSQKSYLKNLHNFFCGLRSHKKFVTKPLLKYHFQRGKKKITNKACNVTFKYSFNFKIVQKSFLLILFSLKNQCKIKESKSQFLAVAKNLNF